MKITLEKLAEYWRIKNAWAKVRKKGASGGLDRVSVADFERNADGNIDKLIKELVSGQYVPEPLWGISVNKPGKREKRELGLPAVRDKIVQTALAETLVEFYNHRFSDCSYAYRPGKGTVRAINRVRDFLSRKYQWVAVLDIDDFFDSIHHETCLALLSQDIGDPGVIRILQLYMENGVFRFDRWEESFDGLPQGGVLSPVLSNLYLDGFDRFLHQRALAFVRYADDLILLALDKSALTDGIAAAETYLKSKRNLRFNPSSQSAIHVSQGFSFLGIYFRDGKIRMDYGRKDRKVETMRVYMESHFDPVAVVNRLSRFFLGIRRYYGRLMPGSMQLDTLENRVLGELSDFIARRKQAGVLPSKSDWKKVLKPLEFIREKDQRDRAETISRVVDDGFFRYQQARAKAARAQTRRSVSSALGKKRQQYVRKIATETELVVSRFGHFVGYTQRAFTVRHKGVVVASVPKNRLKRLVIASPGVSLSSDCIHQCCQKQVAIEFLSKQGEPFAMIYAPQFAISESGERQLKVRDGPQRLRLAAAFLEGKARNQINLLKYFNKYLIRSNPESGTLVDQHLQQMGKLRKALKPDHKARSPDRERDRLMGVEGSISAHYWGAVRLILDPSVPFEKRVARGAKDLFNSCLNYGYGILYNRVQKALADAGAALHISFLHQPQGKKPTLVFDQIEEFRQFVVDRPVIAMCNRKEPLSVDKKGFLTQNSRRLVVENVQERLGSYVRWRRKRIKCEEIIAHQARLLMHDIREEKRYRPFIGRY